MFELMASFMFKVGLQLLFITHGWVCLVLRQNIYGLFTTDCSLKYDLDNRNKLYDKEHVAL